MLWLWAFAIPGILGVLGYDYQKFQCRHHQEMPYRQEFLLAMLIALMEASLNCLFLLLPLFAYQGYDETNLAELLLGFDLFLQALSPREIVLSIHEKHRFPNLTYGKSFRILSSLWSCLLSFFFLFQVLFRESFFVLAPSFLWSRGIGLSRIGSLAPCFKTGRPEFHFAETLFRFVGRGHRGDLRFCALS